MSAIWQHPPALDDVYHTYVLPHLSLLEMYALSQTCTALQRLVSNAPVDLLRTAASQTLPAGLMKPITPIHQLWASLRQHQRLVHHLHHVSHSPMSYKCSWAPRPSALPDEAFRDLSIAPERWYRALDLAAVAARKYGEFQPQRTLLLRPAQPGPNGEPATMLVLNLPGLEERYRLWGHLHEARPPAGGQQQSVAKWYEWSPDGSMIAILWGPVSSTRGSNPDQLTLSMLCVFSAASGAVVSTIQPASSVANSTHLRWLANGSGFSIHSSDEQGLTEVSIINIAGKILSVGSAQFPHLNEPDHKLYLALRSDAPRNARGPVQFVYRMTGKVVDLPADINLELDQCSLAFALGWSHDGRYATLLSEDGSRRWFMCFEKGHLAYSRAQAIPLAVACPPISELREAEIQVLFSPHERAMAAEVTFHAEVPHSPRLLLWHFGGDEPEASLQVLGFPGSTQPTASRPCVEWHPSPSLDIVAFFDGAQLGLFSAATQNCLSSWSIRQLLEADGQHSPTVSQLDLRELSWAPHGCQLALYFLGSEQLRLDFDSR